MSLTQKYDSMHDFLSDLESVVQAYNFLLPPKESVPDLKKKDLPSQKGVPMRVYRVSREGLDSLVSKVEEGRQKNAKSGKIALISDIHSNYWALKAVLEDISQSDAQDIFCAGDVVGYGSRPNACCYLLRALLIPTVMGNHDYGVLNKDFDYIGGVSGDSARKFTAAIINEGNKEWLYFLPVELEGSVDGGRRLFLVHGTPLDPLEDRISPEISNDDLKAYFDKLDSIDILIVGHTHHPFSKSLIDGKEEKRIVNPGSVGQPRDGDPRASYALYEINNLSSEVEFRRVEYDILRTLKCAVSL